MDPRRRRITVAISGPTSSGKTTLADNLAIVFSNIVEVIHQDEFFLPKNEVPVVTWMERGKSNELKTMQGPHADCLQALDWRRFSQRVLMALNRTDDETHLNKVESMHPQSAHNKDEPEPIKELEHLQIREEQVSELPNSRISDLRIITSSIWQFSRQNKIPQKQELLLGYLKDIVIVEGFMLFPSSKALEYDSTCEPQKANKFNERNQFLELISSFDVKIFIPQRRGVCRARRFKRVEYVDVALGGQKEEWQTWKSEEYFNQVAWPEYEKLHSWLLEQANDTPREKVKKGKTRGDRIVSRAVEDSRIEMCPVNEGSNTRKNAEEMLVWAVGVILERLRDLVLNDRAELQNTQTTKEA